MSAVKGSMLVPAPGRGQYDRALSRSRRQAEQRERLLAAAAEAFALEGRNVSLRAVVERAGTGRNTFYEYFDDVEHALRAVRSRTLARLENALEVALAARTPIERLRAVSRAYFETLEPAPYEAALGLWRERESEALSPVGLALRAAYLRAVSATRSLTADDELKALSVAAGAEALFRERVLTPLVKAARVDEQGSVDERARVDEQGSVDERARIDEQRDVEARHQEQARIDEQGSTGERQSSPKGSRVSSLNANRSELDAALRSRASSAGRPKSPVELLVDLAVRVLR